MINAIQAKEMLNEKLIEIEKKNTPIINLPIVLYGAGNLGKLSIDYLKKINLKPEFIIDGNIIRADKKLYLDGVRIIEKSEVQEKQKKNHLLLICVVTDSYIKISDELKIQGWMHILPFYDFVENFRNMHPLSNGWHSEKLSQTDRRKIEKIIDSFEDEISITHYIQFLAWRVLREEWNFPLCKLK
jgi:hypothetical protein